ncbi:hypothetical protein BGW42_002495, partial [Actinomortierella wolfii]
MSLLGPRAANEHLDKRAGQPCATKKCNASYADLSQTDVKREIDILKRLRHRHIIQYFDTIEHNGHTYIVMDLAERGSLAGAIARGEVTDWPTKNRIAHEIARGLEYIHSYDILHRDLKTANVLLTRFMEVKLCDFGLAKVKSLSSSKSTTSFKGTLRWAAPESLELRPQYSTKSDVYALGMVMWAMAANRPEPFDDQHDNMVVIQHVKNGQREVIPESTPPEYRLWIEKCWKQDPKHRPNAYEMVLMKDFAMAMPHEALESALSLSMSTFASMCERISDHEPSGGLDVLSIVDPLQEDHKGLQQNDEDEALLYLRRSTTEGRADA